MHIHELTLSQFRCFGARQTIQLAPVTFLVGENSTGKTSLLALSSVLWRMAFEDLFPNFKEPPYDLGSFDEIAHFRGGRGGRAEEFEVGMALGTGAVGDRRTVSHNSGALRLLATFGRDGPTPIPLRRRFESRRRKVWIEEVVAPGKSGRVRFGTVRGEWAVVSTPDKRRRGTRERSFSDVSRRHLLPLRLLASGVQRLGHLDAPGYEPENGTTLQPDDEDFRKVRMFGFQLMRRVVEPPFASAPVRSRPLRTYEPSPPIDDPEGVHIPQSLSRVARRDDAAWRRLRESLEKFGRAAGLFDEIRIRRLGRGDSGPFQLEVRRYGAGAPSKRAKGPWRNIIDVGYGVSQALPLVTELLRSDVPRTFLIQQPEVHLHPSAQAALGGLLAEAAVAGHQLLVETHSDFIIDRVRMEMRERTNGLRPDDIVILYHERGNLDVRVHSLRWDEDGNILGVPSGYRQFFSKERRRSIGL